MYPRRFWLLALVLVLPAFALGAAQLGKRSVPPPLRVFVSVETAWETLMEVLRKRDLQAPEEGRGQGLLVTPFREYVSGPLTESHLAKVAEARRATDGQWVRVEYQYEIRVDFVEARNTLVTVNVNIRALRREFLGKETWLDVPSNGNLEADLLTAFGQELFGPSFNLDSPRKGYWERAPVYTGDLREGVPRVVGPERPPQQ